jgi:hypothetical protein
MWSVKTAIYAVKTDHIALGARAERCAAIVNL